MRHKESVPAIHRSIRPGAVKFLSTVGPRQIRVIANDATQDLMGDIVEPYGADLDDYRRNPVVLAQHDVNQPIARCTQIGPDNNQIAALIEFPAEGVSARSDEYLRLLKAGVLSAVSIGFLPKTWEPIAGGGLRYKTWSLLELSIVSVPANPNALVTERALRRSGGGVAPAGNCGRPSSKACGLLNPAECVIHGQAGAGMGSEADKMIRLRQSRRTGASGGQSLLAMARRAADYRRRATFDPPAELLTRTDMLRRARELRERHGIKRLDPRVIAANAAFRFRSW